MEQGGTSIGKLHSLYALERDMDQGEGNYDLKLRRSGQSMPKALVTSTTQVHSYEPIHLLLMEFEDIFATPSSLPPH